jgi:hypothetical protein
VSAGSSLITPPHLLPKHVRSKGPSLHLFPRLPRYYSPLRLPPRRASKTLLGATTPHLANGVANLFSS